jgi:hypothetical protein
LTNVLRPERMRTSCHRKYGVPLKNRLAPPTAEALGQKSLKNVDLFDEPGVQATPADNRHAPHRRRQIGQAAFQRGSIVKRLRPCLANFPRLDNIEPIFSRYYRFSK